ncbi:hypothetical protein ABPG75_007258 [Micractinium tetrahymenae]
MEPAASDAVPEEQALPPAALAAALMARCWRLLTPAATFWLLAYVAAALGASVWQTWAGPHLPAHAATASFARWQELPAVLLRVSSFGLGLGWALTRLILNDGGMFAGQPAGQPAALTSAAALAAAAGLVPRLEAAAGHIVTMLFASGVVSLVFTLLCMRVRLCLCLAVQLALAATAWPFNRSICAAVPLASPGAQDRNDRIFALFSALRFLLPLSGGVLSPLPASSEDACVAVMAFLQASSRAVDLGLGTLIPVLVEASAEADLFRLHQQQRRQAGLPLELGWQASLYSVVSFCTQGASASDRGLCCFALLCACWDVCTMFARSSA